MNLYLVTRTDEAYYDEYNALVVRAESANDAKKIALHKHEYGSEYPGFTQDNIRAQKLNAEGERGLIIGSFRAG